MEEFILYLEENIEAGLSVYELFYKEKALEEGEIMLMDPTFCEEGDDIEPEDLYEEYAHTVGHSATYYGAEKVITEMGLGIFDIDEEDEDLQWEVLLVLEKEPN